MIDNDPELKNMRTINMEFVLDRIWTDRKRIAEKKRIRAILHLFA